jgi:hypothetical protein
MNQQTTGEGEEEIVVGLRIKPLMVSIADQTECASLFEGFLCGTLPHVTPFFSLASRVFLWLSIG